MLTTPTISERHRLLANWPGRWRLARWKRIVEAIRVQDDDLRALSDDQILDRSSLLRSQAALDGRPLADLLCEAYALVCQVAWRKLAIRPHSVQLLGAIAIHRGYIAEMQTGEGKTLTATLPAYLNALLNEGVHVVTANDYLARRDAELMRPVYERLGLTVGYLQSQMPTVQRRAAYDRDVTYGTAKEFGFDFLRDRIRQREQDGRPTASPLAYDGLQDTAPVQRKAQFALIDEADNVLLDEARTSLIISGSQQAGDAAEAALYPWCAAIARHSQECSHYQYNEKEKSAELTEAGCRLVQNTSRPQELANLPWTDLYLSVERAIRAARDFARDRDYIIRDGAVVIVDESTGRLGQGRKWSNGIHQAIEAKEGLSVTVEQAHTAQITLQELFSRYPRVAGMTGTAVSSRSELAEIYGLRVVAIPTHRPCRRIQMPDVVCTTAEDKWCAIVEEVRRLQKQGRPVLIGTRSIGKSETLSTLLTAAGIEHQVLNAKQHAEEADIIAKAGRCGKVTVATNMAGRGTDIKLGDGVAEAGGLHVICTELNESPRIDRQLVGRCARQGDPGSFQQFLSLEDDVLEAGFGQHKATRLAQRGRLESTGRHYARLFRAAQGRAEAKRRRVRRNLVWCARQRAKQAASLGVDPYLDWWLL